MEFQLIWLAYAALAIAVVGFLAVLALTIIIFMGPPDLYDVSLEEDRERK